jgi:hypothetical protein
MMVRLQLSASPLHEHILEENETREEERSGPGSCHRITFSGALPLKKKKRKKKEKTK